MRLAGAGLSLVTLPPSVPVDGSLGLQAAHEASVLSDRWSGAWSFLGAVYYRLGRLDDAEQAIRTALKRQQDPQEHPFNPLVLSLIYARRGDRERALAEFQLFRKVCGVNMWLEIREPLEAEARTMLGLAADSIADVPRRYYPVSGLHTGYFRDPTPLEPPPPGTQVSARFVPSTKSNPDRAFNQRPLRERPPCAAGE